ncbi:MAG: hypothetical protein KAR51_00625, partial [Candidatus Aenigmarchaeota archaeon]|nr:hypothetical protein [Candidatus Aenigmarchaeota archaeon]
MENTKSNLYIRSRDKLNKVYSMASDPSDAKKEHFAEIEKALEYYNKGMADPSRTKFKANITSKAYREYKEEEADQRKVGTFFEKMCAYSGKLFKIDLKKKNRDQINEAIEFTALKVTPEGVAGFAVVSLLFFICIGVLSLIMPPSIAPGLIKVTMFALAPITALYILKYPNSYATSVRIKSSGELVMVVLYMIVYMKTTPNLEGAVRFAAESATGKVGRDFKRMLWRL